MTLEDYTIDFNIYEKSQLNLEEDTAFIEFGAGQFKDNFWDNNSIYVDEDAFTILESIIHKHFNSYDHYEITNIPKEVGLKIINDWKIALVTLKNDLDKGQEALSLHKHCHDYWKNVLLNNREKIIIFLETIINYWESIFEKEEWIFIIGL